jgi:hypothetical protein
LKKRTKKLLLMAADVGIPGRSAAPAVRRKSFLVLFFKKEHVPPPLPSPRTLSQRPPAR